MVIWLYGYIHIIIIIIINYNNNTKYIYINLLLLMSSNPNASPDTLSASQQQLLASVGQLQEAQRDLMDRYTANPDPNERKKIASEIDKNALLRSNLLSSIGDIAVVQSESVTNKQDATRDLLVMTGLMEAELKSARDQLEEIQTSRTGKERMIELNTYYGKRFMAQAGVMKIFIYMCIPVLILAVLANMGFLPNYIAGFAIIASIVVGIVYIYGAVSDINRRDKRNFDEYTWEFDPSRVGSVVNPSDSSGSANSSSNFMGCFNGQCCSASTAWDPKSKTCTVQTAQGTGSTVVGANGPTKFATAAPTEGPNTLLGNMNV